MDAHTSEVSVEGEVEVTGSMVTLPSSEFPRRIIENVDDKLEEDGSEDELDDDETSKNSRSVESASKQQPLLPEGSFYGDSSSNAPLLLRSVSVETLAGPDGIPYQSNMSFPPVDVEPSKAEAVSSRIKAVQKVPLTTFEIKLERLKGVEKFDAFSEDEEPVLRKDYQPIEHEPKCPEPDVREEKIVVYNVRKEGVPQFKKLPRWDMIHSGGDHRSSTSSSIYHGKSSYLPSKRQSVRSCRVSPTKSISVRQPLIRKSRSRIEKGRCGRLNENFEDTTPHQRDLVFVSYEELSSKEVAVIKGLWKYITFDLWTFGALTTINLFKLRGHITAKDPQATSDVMMECRFLWPHANHVMKALESVVMNLSRPSVSHRLVHEVGRKHWKLKIPITENQKQLMINAFMYTFANNVHPRPNLNEMRTMRKFCSITMFLFADASRWDSEPLIPF